MRRLALVLAGSFALCACIEESPQAHQGTPRASNFESASSPAPSSAPAAPQPAMPAPAPAANEAAQRAGAIFDNALQVVAYKIEPPTAMPGATVSVTTFLRVLAPIPADEMMFVHVDDAAGQPIRVNGDHWPAGHAKPMTQWKPGEVVRDTFQVALNGFDQSTAAIVWMGFYDPASDTRMSITNAAQVKNDGNNRYALAEIPLTR
jgi:hypothetical protein